MYEVKIFSAQGFCLLVQKLSDLNRFPVYSKHIISWLYQFGVAVSMVLYNVCFALCVVINHLWVGLDARATKPAALTPAHPQWSPPPPPPPHTPPTPLSFLR